MSSRSRDDRGEWVTLLQGVRVSRRWMTRHTPELLAAWCDAPTGQRRRAVATRILQSAADLESEPDDLEQGLTDRTWRTVAERIDTRLVRGPDWPPLAAALTRTAAAGYDVTARLPELVGGAPLPDRHPARELHWRLLDHCPAALPTRRGLGSTTVRDAPAETHNSAGRPQVHRDTPPQGRGHPASTDSPPAKETPL